MKSSIFFEIVLMFIILMLLWFCFVLLDKNRRLLQSRKMLNSTIKEKQKEINELTLCCNHYMRLLREKNTLDTDRKSNI